MRRYFFALLTLFGPAAFSQTLSVYAGNGQIVREQFLTVTPMVVLARDAQGNAIANLPVTWTITQGQGTIVNPPAKTDSNGLAQANFLGTDVPLGLSYTQATITASSSAGSASFIVTTAVTRLPGGGLGAPPLVELLAPALDNRYLTGRAGSVLPGAVQVRVSIQSGVQAGQPLANAGVRIYNYDDPATTPSAACRGGSLLTDAAGIATCDLVLNSVLGIGQLSAIAGESQITPSFFVTITPGNPCTYALTPSAASFTSAGGAGSFSLTAGAGCNWAAASNAAWAVLTGPLAGSGNAATIGFVVSANTGGPRTAVITAGSQTFTISQTAAGAPGPLTILTGSPLPSGTVGSAYSLQLQASGGAPPYRWSAASLPNGLTLSGAGLLNGTPAAASTTSLSIAINDAAGARVAQNLSLTISSSASTSGPVITNGLFPNGTAGQAYRQPVTFTTSCTNPFSSGPTIAVSSGTLPPGLSLATPVDKTWIITGTPTTNGAYTFTLTISEVCSRTSTSTFTIVIGNGGGATGGAISASPAAVSFTVGAGTSVKPADALINLTSSTGAQISYSSTVSFAGAGGWLTISNNASGTTPATLSLSAGNFQNLQAGTYSALLNVQGGGTTISIPVALNVITAAPLTVTPASLLFSSLVLQGPGNLQQTLQVTSASASHFTVGVATAGSNANWLGATPGEGNTPAQVTAVVNPVGLRPGTYTGVIQITPAGQAPVSVPVTLVVTTPPALSWSLPAVNSSYLTGGPMPLPVTVNLASAGSPLQFQLTAPQVSWLSIDNRSGTTPANITLSFDPTGLMPGVYQTSVTATSPSTATPSVALQVSLAVRQTAPAISAIVNGASFLPGPLAPGLELQITGSSLGPVTQADGVPDDSGRYPTLVGGARVYFDGVPAAILHASDQQITVLVPYAVAGQAASNVVAEYRAAQSAPMNVIVAESSPALFTGAAGQGVIFNEDGSYNGLTSAAALGSVVSILGTGEGQTNPAGVDGLLMQDGSLASPVLPVSVQIAGLDAPLVSATSAPGQPAGVFLIKVRVPKDTPPNSVLAVTVTIGSAQSQGGVTLVTGQ